VRKRQNKREWGLLRGGVCNKLSLLAGKSNLILFGVKNGQICCQKNEQNWAKNEKIWKNLKKNGIKTAKK
jgi:hypothetical protein